MSFRQPVSVTFSDARYLGAGVGIGLSLVGPMLGHLHHESWPHDGDEAATWPSLRVTPGTAQAVATAVASSTYVPYTGGGVLAQQASGAWYLAAATAAA